MEEIIIRKRHEIVKWNQTGEVRYNWEHITYGCERNESLKRIIHVNYMFSTLNSSGLLFQ